VRAEGTAADTQAVAAAIGAFSTTTAIRSMKLWKGRHGKDHHSEETNDRNENGWHSSAITQLRTLCVRTFLSVWASAYKTREEITVKKFDEAMSDSTNAYDEKRGDGSARDIANERDGNDTSSDDSGSGNDTDDSVEAALRAVNDYERRYRRRDAVCDDNNDTLHQREQNAHDRSTDGYVSPTSTRLRPMHTNGVERHNHNENEECMTKRRAVSTPQRELFAPALSQRVSLCHEALMDSPLVHGESNGPILSITRTSQNGHFRPSIDSTPAATSGSVHFTLLPTTRVSLKREHSMAKQMAHGGSNGPNFITIRVPQNDHSHSRPSSTTIPEGDNTPLTTAHSGKLAMIIGDFTCTISTGNIYKGGTRHMTMSHCTMATRDTTFSGGIYITMAFIIFIIMSSCRLVDVQKEVWPERNLPFNLSPGNIPLADKIFSCGQKLAVIDMNIPNGYRLLVDHHCLRDRGRIDIDG
jgi:hypothetical protein